jgi:hypothetical protein
MSAIHVTALLALSALALPASPAFAQIIFGPGMAGGSDRSTPGRVIDDESVYTCQGAPGGSRIRESCETETTTARHEQEIKLSFKLNPLPAAAAQCSARTATAYEQRNDVARVNSTFEITDCAAAAAGTFTVAVRVKDESGEERPLEFSETWQRSDANDVAFTADYPIGENVELVQVRLRGLSCTCASPAVEDQPQPAAE